MRLSGKRGTAPPSHYNVFQSYSRIEKTSSGLLKKSPQYGNIAQLHFNAEIAQLVEHFHGKEKVPGSIPGLGSSFKARGVSPTEIRAARSAA